MKCEEAVRAIPLYLYGEVSASVEELLEDHLAGCAVCAQELSLQKAVNTALDSREMMVPAGLLQECRGDLTRRVGRQAAQQQAESQGWFGLGSWLRDLMHHGIPFRVPVSAMALIAVGYFAARLTNPTPFGSSALPVTSASLETPGFSSAIRSIEPQSSGTVHISLDETHRREVTGRIDDEKILRLMLAGVREENNAGVRVESVGMLKDCVQSSSVRAALLDRVLHDPIAGVRWKAIDALRAFGNDPGVRQTLAQVLLHDDNAGVRIETIDVLKGHHDDSMVGILQGVFQKEDNQYVRIRVQSALQEMHATPGTF
jgi:hypothetical protein